MKKITLLAMAFFGFSAQATQTIYDQDSQANHITSYSFGPVARVQVNTSTADYIEALVIVASSDVSCQQAALYNDRQDTKIVDLDARSPVFTGALPRGNEAFEKSIRIHCTQGDETFVVHHKVPAAPQIIWNSTVTAENWIYPCGDHCYYGYFDDVEYSSQIFIDNRTDDGICYSNNYLGETPDLLLGYQESTPLHSDHFSTVGEAIYNANASVMVNEVICKNAGGTTRALEVWIIKKNTIEREFHTHSY